jgi:hypothetical protein
MGGMFTIVKVHPTLPPPGEDAGWYDAPPDTVARRASADELRADGIDVDVAADAASRAR